MTSDQSGGPLRRKLGIRPGEPVLVLGDPFEFDVTSLAIADGPDDALRMGKPGSYPVVLLFCPESSTLHSLFGFAKAAHTTTGSLWVCWPKRASGIVTDLTDVVVRDYGLAGGRVDIKVAAIDPTWSGLKFVIRLSERRARSNRRVRLDH
ncbi:hypothetical protein ABIB25_004511 [Nakamurella sp. UYEF19]|uniref:DUF3052 domain-containing protein n=1 Tax=Nakamurella sp. UYEF19 TaxID=1756392 RepID=UPI0033923F4C